MYPALQDWYCDTDTCHPVFPIRIGYMRILVKFEPSFLKVNKTNFFQLIFLK
jgi:hypothetical protein